VIRFQRLKFCKGDRFKLVIHQDTRPLPTYALVVGRKPELKEANGSEENGCRPQPASGLPGEGGGRLMMSTESILGRQNGNIN
jgi:uncharacterized protein (TIGR03435 family)